MLVESASADATASTRPSIRNVPGLNVVNADGAITSRPRVPIHPTAMPNAPATTASVHVRGSRAAVTRRPPVGLRHT
jgi:hypothetical protein